MTKTAHPAGPLQMAMNYARKFIWKHMSTEQKARYLLRKAMTGIQDIGQAAMKKVRG